MWYRFSGAPKMVKNLYPEVFFVEKENDLGAIELTPIKPGMEMNRSQWSVLLKTNHKFTGDEENLFKLISSRVENINGNNIFKFGTSPKSIKNPIDDGFYINSINDDFIGPETILSPESWRKLLHTSPSKIYDKDDKNKLRDFLLSSFIKMDGKNIYPIKLKNKPIKNLYPYEFWVDKIKVLPGDEKNVTAWMNLLHTSSLNVNDENLLRDFLTSKIQEQEGKKYYPIIDRSVYELPNPIKSGFWVNEKINNSGEIVLVPKFIPFGEPMGINQWKKLLQTNKINGKNTNSLIEFLTRDKFKIIRKRKFYLPPLIGDPILISNPIKGGFWVNEKINDDSEGAISPPKYIRYGQPMGVAEWRRLLSTHKIDSEDKDSLRKFLSDDKFQMVGKRRFYIPLRPNEEVLIKNPISEGFDIDGDFIGPERTMNISEWTKKLKTGVIMKHIQSLEEFLSDKLTRNKEGKLIYTYDPRKKFYIKNPISEGFYIHDDPVDPETFMSTSDWRRLLGTEKIYRNNPNSLRDFLNQPGIITEIDGKKYYNYTGQKRYITNPLNEIFWVNKRPIEPNQKFTVTEWAKLLNTSSINTSNEEILKDFLSDRRRIKTINNKKTYIPVKRSFREGLFGEKFNSYNHDDITVKAGQYIIVMTNKTNILYLDFAFMKNGNILLAVEINGYQHYGFVSFGKKRSYNEWQDGLKRDVLKINYCHDNKIPLLIFNHMLSLDEFKTIVNNLHKNPHAYDNFIPQPSIDNNPKNTSLEFIKRQIYSHFYPVFNGTITFENDESKKRYIKDTLILISKLMGIYEGDIDKTDYINSFDLSTDLTSNYNICLSMYNLMYPDYPLDRDEKITYSDLSKIPRLYKEKPPIVKKPKETNLVPTEEFKDKDNVV